MAVTVERLRLIQENFLNHAQQESSNVIKLIGYNIENEHLIQNINPQTPEEWIDFSVGIEKCLIHLKEDELRELRRHLKVNTKYLNSSSIAVEIALNKEVQIKTITDLPLKFTNISQSLLLHFIKSASIYNPL